MLAVQPREATDRSSSLGGPPSATWSAPMRNLSVAPHHHGHEPPEPAGEIGSTVHRDRFIYDVGGNATGPNGEGGVAIRPRRWRHQKADVTAGRRNIFFNSLAQVLPQVESIGELQARPGCLTCSFRIAAGSVPADHLRTWPSIQPPGQSVAVPAVDEVDRPSRYGDRYLSHVFGHPAQKRKRGGGWATRRCQDTSPESGSIRTTQPRPV